jgi:hypothetical protein
MYKEHPLPSGLKKNPRESLPSFAEIWTLLAQHGSLNSKGHMVLLVGTLPTRELGSHSQEKMGISLEHTHHQTSGSVEFWESGKSH